ncbi:MAG TPA: CpcT/CpeT family chromophore lyase [Steroidobacteraceae bacterium]|nr:CpcT/CpeT family chromophore lyase [Steroidobacteraceae bacterium]
MAERLPRRVAHASLGLPAGLLPAGLLAAGLLAALLLPAACTDQTKIQEADLAELLAVLPGHYDNSAQVEADTRNHVNPLPDAVALTITHVFTPRLGHHVYYAQETAADDPRRVFSQKMYSFTVDEKRGIVESLYELVEPLRWRDGQMNKDMFTAMQIEDVQPEACELLWKKKDAGFVATHDPKRCPEGAAGSVVPQAELQAGVLTIGSYKFRRTSAH